MHRPIDPAVGTQGGKRADRLTVPELATLLATRGWALPPKSRATQATLLACAVAGCAAARVAAVAARPAGAPALVHGSPEDQRACWDVLVDEAAVPADANDGATVGQHKEPQLRQRPSGSEDGGEEAMEAKGIDEEAACTHMDEEVDEGVSEGGDSSSSGASSSDDDGEGGHDSDDDGVDDGVAAAEASVRGRRGSSSSSDSED